MSLRTDPGPQKFDAANLQRFGQSLLIACGLAEDRARDVAEVLLEGDLLGHTTHGFALLPAYLKAIQERTMETVGEPDVIADHGSSLTWDGRYLPGPWLVRRAIAIARARITEYPVVTISIRRSQHIGCLQAYLQPVTEAGLVIFLCCSDPASRTVTPHGGVAPRFSPNPLAAGIPTDSDPILIDISTSSTSNGLCNRLAAAGEPLPGPWLVNRDGHVTDDPRVLEVQQGGAILPLGGMDLGYKGFALALLVEALTNALAGHGRADNESCWGASVFLQILDPERFGGRASFLHETSFLTRLCQENAGTRGKTTRSPTRTRGTLASQGTVDERRHVSSDNIARTGWLGSNIGCTAPTVTQRDGLETWMQTAVFISFVS